MSTELDSKRNGCYNITATRFGGRDGLMCQLTVGDGSQWMCIALHKDDVIEMCERIINGMREFDKCTCPSVACPVHGLPAGSSSGGW